MSATYQPLLASPSAGRDDAWHRSRVLLGNRLRRTRLRHSDELVKENNQINAYKTKARHTLPGRVWPITTASSAPAHGCLSPFCIPFRMRRACHHSCSGSRVGCGVPLA